MVFLAAAHFHAATGYEHSQRIVNAAVSVNAHECVLGVLMVVAVVMMIAGDGITYPTRTDGKTNSRAMRNYALV